MNETPSEHDLHNGETMTIEFPQLTPFAITFVTFCILCVVSMTIAFLFGQKAEKTEGFTHLAAAFVSFVFGLALLVLLTATAAAKWLILR